MIEWSYFLNYLRATPTLCPYRTEWLVYYEEMHLSGSIDMVYENEDGTLSIYDWKRAKEIAKRDENQWHRYATTAAIDHIPDTNFWHYALQLNIYRTILQRKYGKTVRDLALVRLHPDAGDYELIPVPLLDSDMDVLFEERRRGIVGDKKRGAAAVAHDCIVEAEAVVAKKKSSCRLFE